MGENGAGKSTLLHLMSGDEPPDEGEVVTVAEGGVGLLAQTPRLPADRCVTDAIDAALAELRSMEARLRSRSASAPPTGRELGEYGDLLTAFELRGGYEADARVDKAMHGLGLLTSTGTESWAACPAASRPGWASPACWPRHPSSCSWTSRPTTWTRARWTGWRTPCPHTAGRWSPSPTTARSWSASRPRSSKWTRTAAPSYGTAAATKDSSRSGRPPDGAGSRSTRSGARRRVASGSSWRRRHTPLPVAVA